MISSVYLRGKVDQMCLTFDCLSPEEAHKILDCLFEEKMDDVLAIGPCDVQLNYCVNGYRMKDDKKKWSHDLVIEIVTQEANDGTPDDIVDQLKSDREFLERLRDVILEYTGIKEED